MLLLLAAAQFAALVLLLTRLWPGRTRRPPVAPATQPMPEARVSVVLATLNEAERIGPCLAGLMQQGPELLEVLVVDSRSRDGTGDVVLAAAARDPRIRLLHDDPLPAGWVGKVWALETGLREARGRWMLGVDADTAPEPGMVAAVVQAAEADGYDVVSFGPRFAGMTAAERWLQPALLTTLVYRFGPAGEATPAPDRVMANGQCFLARRDLLVRHGGYAPSRLSFCDDVTLARHLAHRGARVGFLDGSRIISVRAYTSAAETWREWGRSLDLKDASTRVRQWGDVVFLALVQGLPIPLLLLYAAVPAVRDVADAGALATVSAVTLGVRLLFQFALRGSYERRGLPFWLSPLADPAAAFRILLSTMRTPTRWRGRAYDELAA